MGYIFVENFKPNVIGTTHQIPTATYRSVMDMVEEPNTVQQAKAIINTRLRELKAQPGTPPKTPKKGKGFIRATTKAKAKSRLKPIQEDEEERIIIKPAKQHLTYIDAFNNPYLVNKLH